MFSRLSRRRGAKETKAPAGSRESKRLLIVRLIFIIYWLLIFEGALRKWIFPGLQKPLFFIRDPFVLTVYILALRYGFWPRWTPIFTAGVALGGFFLALVILQTVAVDLNPLVGIYGWRNYFWYLPLAFIIGEQLRGKELGRLIRHTLLIGIPMALLVMLQFRSPPGAFINRTLDPSAKAFEVVRDVVRTTGTFTFAAGQALFAGSIVPMILSLWMLPDKERPLRGWLLVIASGAVLANLAVTGSRSAFVFAGIAIVAGFSSVFLMTKPEMRMRALVMLTLICLCGAGLFVTVFHRAYEVMKTRQEMAEQGEGSTMSRALSTVTDVLEVFPATGPLGVGIGVGTTGGGAIATGQVGFALAETEWPRIVQEAGVSGLLYIAFRILLVGWLFWGAVKATRRSNSPLPLLMWGFAGAVMSLGQVTLQGTTNGYGWLFAGFSMAANQLGSPSRSTNKISRGDLAVAGGG